MKKLFLAVVATVTLVLSGCGGKAVGADGLDAVETDEVSELADEVVDEIEVRKAECLALAEYGDILDLSWEGEPIAPNVIVDDYVSGRQEYLDQYYVVRDDCIMANAYLGDAHISCRSFYPGATCGEEWSVRGLVAGYNKKLWSWAEDAPWHLYLHSRDYRHCFEISNGWLQVDDVKVCPVGDYIVEDISPETILSAYQSGAWDGEMPILSRDYSTTVTLNKWSGTLEYDYKRTEYTDGYDVMQLAYQPYFDSPKDLVMATNYKYAVDCHLDLERNFDEFSEEIYEAEVELYADLPDGTMNGFEDRLGWEYAGTEVGIYMLMPDRIELYHCGNLVDTWMCDITTATPKIRQYINNNNFGTEAHAWISDEEILRLLPGGKTETVLDGLTGDVYGIGEYGLMELSLKDGKLTGYSDICGVVEIAENVESVDFAWNVAFFTGKDGLCYSFDEDDYMALEQEARSAREVGYPIESTIKVHCMGEEPWEYYKNLYFTELWASIQTPEVQVD